MHEILCRVAMLTAASLALHAQTTASPTPFVATAYTGEGVTRSGLPAQPGTVAADPKVLPLGTKIRVSNAGPQNGVYTVVDTGSAVKGRHIDIFLPTWNRAREFGRKIVHVRVLKWGSWRQPER